MSSDTKRALTLFRYPGGKFYALRILNPFWQSIKHDEYREPFVGGGSVFLAKPKARHNWLNDIDHELVTAYQCIQEPRSRSKLLKRLETEVANKERWKEVFESTPKTKFDVAYKYFYLNRTSFSGKLSSPAWGYREKRSLPPERWKERIIPAGEKLYGVKITDHDFQEIIDAPALGSDVLMFVDPPYFSPPKKKHYRNGFNLDDHLRLEKSLRRTPHKFFLTYDDVPEIRELYSWANIYEIKFFYRVDNSNIENGNRRMGFELIVTNYELPKQLNIF